MLKLKTYPGQKGHTTKSTSKKSAKKSGKAAPAKRAEKRAKAEKSAWVRLRSSSDEKYTLVISERSLQRVGYPVDPQGKKMVKVA